MGVGGDPLRRGRPRQFVPSPSGVWKQFPKEEGVESYLGVPLQDPEGSILGHLAIFDSLKCRRSLGCCFLSRFSLPERPPNWVGSAQWINSAKAKNAFAIFYEAPIMSIGMSAWTLEQTFHHWINDGLMTLFFLVVGLELKREVLVGELASLRDAALPIVAAIGGMVVPAAIYLALNPESPAAHGWGIPMATDIALAIGILVLLAWRVPRGLIVFLMALAIADDLGAVLVIAIFYTGHLDVGALVSAAATWGVLMLLNQGGIRQQLPYWVFGVILWYFMLRSGVHATIAGILLAFTIPARPAPARTPEQFDARVSQLLAAFRAHAEDPSTPSDPLTSHDMATIAGQPGARFESRPEPATPHGARAEPLGDLRRSANLRFRERGH